MKLFKLDKFPKIYSWSYNDDAEELTFDFGEKWTELKHIALIPDAIFYWYVSGDYEGSGELLATKDGKWYYKNLSHCSCYGPLNDFANTIEEYSFDSLESLISHCSTDLTTCVSPLVELAKKEGYK